MRDKIQAFCRRHAAALLILLFLAVGAPFSPAFFKLVAGTGLTGGTQTIYPGQTATISLTTPVAVANGGTNSTAALSNSRPLVSSGGAIVETASACGSTKVLVGGSPPDCGNWITSTASFNTLGSRFTITAANGTYAGTGLTFTFGGAGTYWCTASVRSSVAVSAGAGANISLKLRNTTTSTDLTNSIRIGAYASTVGVAYITTTPMMEVVTVTGADTIEVYAASNTGTTYTARSVDSDTAGYSKLGCMKIAP